MTRALSLIMTCLSITYFASEAHADTHLVGGIELGALASTEQSGRRDLAGLGSLLIGAEWRKGDWSYSVQAGIPMLPGLTAQIPVAAKRFFGDYFYLVGAFRPMFTLVGQCQNDADLCPRKQQVDPLEQNPGGMMIGGFGSLGFGIGSRSQPWALRLEASYMLGYAVGIDRAVDTETALDGTYQGGMINLGARY